MVENTYLKISHIFGKIRYHRQPCKLKLLNLWTTDTLRIYPLPDHSLLVFVTKPLSQSQFSCHCESNVLAYIRNLSLSKNRVANSPVHMEIDTDDTDFTYNK